MLQWTSCFFEAETEYTSCSALFAYGRRKQVVQDVIFDVNVRSAVGERWSIGMQLEVRPSPCSPHLDVDLMTSQ